MGITFNTSHTHLSITASHHSKSELSRSSTGLRCSTAATTVVAVVVVVVVVVLVATFAVAGAAVDEDARAAHANTSLGVMAVKRCAA